MVNNLKVTKGLRDFKSTSLFVSTKEPYKAVCFSTISRWVKRAMEESGIDTSVFSTHSTRHATTLAVFSKWGSIDEIRRTAAWIGES